MKKMSLFFLIVMALYINFSSGYITDIENIPSRPSVSSVADCIVEIMSSVLFNPTVIMIQNEDSVGNENNVTNEIIEHFQEHGLAIIVITPENLEETKEVLVENYDVVVIAHFENCSSLFDYDVEIFFNTWKYLVILSNFEDECKYINTKITGKSGNSSIKNDVTFIANDYNDNITKFLTFIPEIDDQTCGYSSEIKPTQINACIDGILMNKEVFPTRRPTNFKKCPFNVGVSHMFPFGLISERLEDLSPLQTASGSDVAIVKTLADHMNLTLKLFYVTKDEKSAFRTNVIKYMLNGSLNACIGGHYRVFGNIIDYSGIYNRQALVWIYPVHREDRNWQTLLEKLNGFYVFFIFYIFYATIWYAVSRFDDRATCLKDTLFYCFGALIGCASLQEAYTLKQRLLNIVYLYMCLHLSAYISVQFYSFLTIQGPPEILKTNEEIMSSGRTAYLNNDTKYFTTDAKYLAFARTSNDCLTFEHCAKKILQHNGVTLILDAHFSLFQLETAVNGEASVLRATDNVLTVYHEMLLSRNSPVVWDFQRGVTKLFEAGICDHLFMEAVGLTVVSKAESASKSAMGNSYSCGEGCPITWLQTGGAFYAWGLGCGLSVSVFVLEVLSKRERNGRNLSFN